MHDADLSPRYFRYPIFCILYDPAGVHFWQVILRMRKTGPGIGSGERARNLLCGREALAGFRGRAMTEAPVMERVRGITDAHPVP